MKKLFIRLAEAAVVSFLLDGEVFVVFAFFPCEFGIVPTVSRGTRFLPFLEIEELPGETLELSTASEFCFSVNSSSC